MDGTTNMDPVLTGVGIIGQVGPRTISGGSHTQSIVQAGKSIIRSDVITHVLTNSSEVTLKNDSLRSTHLRQRLLWLHLLLNPF